MRLRRISAISRARPEAAASRGQPLPAWAYLMFFADFRLSRWRQNSTKRPPRRPRSGAGAVFYQIGATGIRAVDIIRNRPTPRVASAEAIGGAGESVI
ncbi:MAG TPA: hypothetical protein DCZ93_01160 [Elusimicrobia bacterium]|nr:hypothetical protein [Elusimicrobiota bacterium]